MRQGPAGRLVAGLLAAAVLAAGCAGGPAAVAPLDPEDLLAAVEDYQFEEVAQEQIAELRAGLLAQAPERLDDLTAARVVADGRPRAVAVVLSFDAVVDPAITDGMISGALDGEEPTQRRTVDVGPDAPVTLFSGRDVQGAVWVEAGTVVVVLASEEEIVSEVATAIARTASGRLATPAAYDPARARPVQPA